LYTHIMHIHTYTHRERERESRSIAIALSGPLVADWPITTNKCDSMPM